MAVQFKIIEKLLEERKKTQTWLCRESGISQTTIQRWKTGKAEITDESLQKVAQAFGVTVEYLRGEPERLTPEQGELVVSLVETIDRLQAILTRSVRDPEYAKSVLKEVRERETKLQGFACLLRETLAQKTPPDSSA